MGQIDFKKVAPILERNDVKFAAIFGSTARGEAKKDSDVDILIGFNKPKSLISIIGLEMELSEALKKKVDLVTETALCPHIRESVFKELNPIYGQR